MRMQDQEPDAPVRMPRAVFWGLVAAVVLDTVAQVLWKSGVSAVQSDNLAGVVAGSLRQPAFIAAMLLFIPKYFNWMHVLARADLSYAKPITAASFVTVTLASVLILHEKVTLTGCAGIALILSGVWFITATPHSTREAP